MSNVEILLALVAVYTLFFVVASLFLCAGLSQIAANLNYIEKRLKKGAKK